MDVDLARTFGIFYVTRVYRWISISFSFQADSKVSVVRVPIDFFIGIDLGVGKSDHEHKKDSMVQTM